MQADTAWRAPPLVAHWECTAETVRNALDTTGATAHEAAGTMVANPIDTSRAAFAQTMPSEAYGSAIASLRMIREAIETLGPVDALISPEAVLLRYGPEPVHEAEAIVEAIRLMCEMIPSQAQRECLG